MEIDPTNGRAPYETAFDLPFAFGNSDLRRASLPVRYTYLCVNPHVEMDGWFRGVGRFDFQTGQMRVFDFGAGHATHEPLFVPRPGGAEEDDGWLLVYVHNAAREATDVQVLSARAVEDGPIATLHLPVHAGLTFHGTWVPAA